MKIYKRTSDDIRKVASSTILGNKSEEIVKSEQKETKVEASVSQSKVESIDECVTWW